jgi:hypothetical protein
MIFLLIRFVFLFVRLCARVRVSIYWSQERVMKKSAKTDWPYNGEKMICKNREYRVCEIIVSCSYTTNRQEQRTNWLKMYIIS